MADESGDRSGDRHTVRIGGDAAGPVVVGRGNRVEVTHQAAQEPAGTTPAPATGDETGPDGRAAVA